MGHKSYKWVIPSYFSSFLIIAILILSSLPAKSQANEESETGSSSIQKKEKKGFDPKRLVFGGSLGATFGSITYVEISPRVGYKLTDQWIAGVGFKYAYYEEKNTFFNYSTNMYGGGVYTQYYFLKYFVAHAEYEVLNLDDFRPPFERVNIHSLFVGGGISSRVGNGFFNVLMLYNLNETYNSPYSNPYVLVGVGVGL